MTFLPPPPRRAPLLLTVLALAPLVGCQSPGPAPDHSAPSARSAPPLPARTEIQAAVDAVYPALVRIYVVFEEGNDGRMQKRRATGSGAIITDDGYIVTNHHVAGRGTRLVCCLANREEVSAVLIGTDPLSDIAVLKIDPAARRDPRPPLPFARFGNSDGLKVGDVVFAMGSPAGLSQSVTEGIVANTAMISPGGGGGFVLDGEAVGELVRWIGHDAVIYPGNSGGPLVNLRGQIIGINEVGIGSLGGAIPSNLAQTVARELIARGRVSRSWIGLEVQPLLKQMTNTAGILVATVLADSPAQAAGLRAGDIITAVGTTPVAESRAGEDVPVFNRLLLTAPVGAEVSLRGLHDGQEQTWRVTTVEREPREAPESELKSWGLTVRDLSRVAALERQRTNQQGVLVHSIRPGGPVSEAKPPLREGDIITRVAGQAVTNVSSLQSFTREFTRGESAPQPVLVGFERDAQEFVTVARIGPEPQDDKPARPAKAWLGAQTQVLTSELAAALGQAGKKGVRVTQVAPGSPAEKAGLQTGDLLLKLDGQVIAASTPSDQELFDNLIRAYKINGTAELEGVRDGQPLKLTANLARRPQATAELPEFKDDRFEFTVRDLSQGERTDDKLGDELQGVRVSAVQPAGWAALAGLLAGDVLLTIDNQPVADVAAVRERLTRLRESKPARVTFFVRRRAYTTFVEVEPTW